MNPVKEMNLSEALISPEVMQLIEKNNKKMYRETEVLKQKDKKSAEIIEKLRKELEGIKSEILHIKRGFSIGAEATGTAAGIGCIVGGAVLSVAFPPAGIVLCTAGAVGTVVGAFFMTRDSRDEYFLNQARKKYPNLSYRQAFELIKTKKLEVKDEEENLVTYVFP